MFLLFYILLPAAFAQISWTTAPENNIPIYAKPSSEARVLFYTNAGEKLGLRSVTGGFTRVQVRRGGKWRAGYIYSQDLIRGEKRRASTLNLALGGGALFSYLAQGEKSFTTQDQVQYQTSEFTSTTPSAAIALQFGRKNFWRLLGTYRQTDFSATASTNVSGAATKDVQVRHTMMSGAVQRVWSSKSEHLYWGLGFEASRTIAVEVKIAGTDVPTSDEDLPTYMGVHGVLGAQFWFSHGISAFVDLRPLVYVNQSPMVMGVEIAASLMYWP